MDPPTTHQAWTAGGQGEIVASTDRMSDMALLAPFLRERAERGLAKARAAGLAVHVFETLRNDERQELLYAQGRSLPGPIITNARAGMSWHGFGLALDCAFDAIPATPKVEWTWNGKWRELGAIMMAEGLVWLGAPGSPFPEAPHFQFTGGLSLGQARALKARGGLLEVWNAINRPPEVVR